MHAYGTTDPVGTVWIEDGRGGRVCLTIKEASRLQRSQLGVAIGEATGQTQLDVRPDGPETASGGLIGQEPY